MAEPAATATAADPALDRAQRALPGSGGAPPPPPPANATMTLATPKLVSPTTGQTHNTLQLTSWFELRLLSPHAKPIPDERVQMFDPQGKVVEKKTDKDGVVRFDGLPLVPPAGTDWNDSTHPAVIFPDILEEWVPAPVGAFGKHDGKRDDYRKSDGMVHFVPKLDARTDVKVEALTSEQKLQHFIDAHVDGQAKYEHANPGDFVSANRRWEWGKGSVCNQHVNFFLGYWCNYNQLFTAAGKNSAMKALPLYTSAKHTLGGVTHRSYFEFLDPVTDFGKALETPYKVSEPSTWPKVAAYNKSWRRISYIRIATLFDYDTGTPTDDGNKLLQDLGDVNVYSIGDIKRGTPAVKKGEDAIRAWLKKNRDTRADAATDKEIDKKKSEELWQIAFDLDDHDEIDAPLIKTLRNLVTWDHHCGVLLVRKKGNLPLTPDTKPEDKELWTFNADGSKVPGPLMKPKRFGDPKDKKGTDLYRYFLHVGIWRLKTLAAGGFGPDGARANEGKIGVDWPPRYIKWG